MTDVIINQTDADFVKGRDRTRKFKWFAGGVAVVLGAIALIADPTADPDDMNDRSTPYAALDGQKVILTVSANMQRGETIWAFNFAEDVNVSPVQEVVDVVVDFDFDNPVLEVDGLSVLRPKTEQRISERADTTQPVTLVFSLPTLGNTAGLYEDDRAGRLQVTLSPDRVTYDYPTQKNWGRPPSFVEQITYLAQFACQPDGAYAPGIERLREPTEAELIQINATYKNRGPRYDSRNGCLGKAATGGAAYVVTEGDRYSGYGKCINYGAPGASANCTFTFFLPQGLPITYRFSETHLPMLRDIDAFVRAELRAATVKSASQNIVLP